MSIQEIDVEYVAGLARMALSPAEKTLFQRQLGTIVAYVDKIAEVDLEGVEPTSHGRELANVMRSDEPRPGLDREEVLANAPARVGATFRVPRILE